MVGTIAAMRSRTILIAAGLTAALAAAAGCAPADDDPATPAASGGRRPPRRTAPRPRSRPSPRASSPIGTDDPAYPPWFIDNKPDNGEGFESAVAYAVADQLGYAKDQVVWIRVTFNNAIAPGPEDVRLRHQRVLDHRGAQAGRRLLVAVLRRRPRPSSRSKGSKIAGAKSLADLKDAKLGAQVGTTSYRRDHRGDQADRAAAVFNNNDDAKKALENGRSTALVVDLPTAFYITARRARRRRHRRPAAAAVRHAASSSGWCWTRARALTDA